MAFMGHIPFTRSACPLASTLRTAPARAITQRWTGGWNLPAMRLLRGLPEQAVGGGQIGDDVSGRALAGEHGGALAGVDAEGVVVTVVAGGCNLGLGRR